MSGGTLASLSVLVTRPEGQADELIAALEGRGATVLHVPAIRFVPVPPDSMLNDALRRLTDYDWLVFTSANAVNFVGTRLSRTQTPGDTALFLPPEVKIAAIGAATARAVAERFFGRTADLVPPEAVAESLRDALIAAGVGLGTRVLLPQPVVSRDVLATGLRAVGAVVDVVSVYETVPNREGGSDITAWLDAPGEKIVIVTSPSTVMGLLDMLDGEVDLLVRISLVCIGPVTAEAVTKLGLKPALVAAEHTNAGLIAALELHYAGVTA